MTVPEDEWVPRLATLVDQLSRNSDVRSAAWRAAFAEIPRHVFVPDIIMISESGPATISGADPAQRQSWLDRVYSDDSLVTQYLPHPSLRTAGKQPVLVSTSSSTMPSLMARMLEALDVHDGHRVLEIGTGTGYHAALLCHRLGAANVVSIDIDPTLVAAARDRLAGLGYHPALVVGDGAAGVAQHGPYDRIIVTAAVADIPLPWIAQLAPGGKILTNLRGELAGGTLCLLTKDDDDELIGPVLALGGHFMWLRPQASTPLRAPEPSLVRSVRHAARTSTALDPTALVGNDSFRFLLQLQLYGARSFCRIRVHHPHTRDFCDGVLLDARDGSHAEVITNPESDGRRSVVQAGARRLWDSVEAAHQLWCHLGRPDPSRFGIVANPTTQFVWFDTDDSRHRWPLPLV
ncbi:MAG: methyltransferase domain-containing protein [Pseudonocardiaceae bacterium]